MISRPRSSVRLSTAVAVMTAAMIAGPAAAAGPGDPPKPAKQQETGGRTVDLRPKFRVGRDIRYQFDLTSANKLKSTSTPELDGDQTLTQSISLKLRTVEVGEDGTTIELEYERIKAALETADFRAEFDSNGPAGKPSTPPATTNPGRPARNAKPGAAGPGKGAKGAADPEMSDLLAQIMRPMVGTKLTMKIDRDGNIRSVSGGEALAGGSASGLEGLIGGLGKGAGGLGGLGGSGIGGIPMPTAGGGGANAGPMGWIVTGPGQKSVVRVGESWTNNDSLSGTPIGGFSMITKHTCKSASATNANLSFSGRADAQSAGQRDGGAGPGGLLGGFALKDSSYGGTYTWDTGRGELKDLSSTLNTRIEQSSGNEGSTQLTAETRINVRRLD